MEEIHRFIKNKNSLDDDELESELQEIKQKEQKKKEGHRESDILPFSGGILRGLLTSLSLQIINDLCILKEKSKVLKIWLHECESQNNDCFLQNLKTQNKRNLKTSES